MIKVITYKESRQRYFEDIIKQQERWIAYWENRTKTSAYMAETVMAEAGDIISYCRDALEALKKMEEQDGRVDKG